MTQICTIYLRLCFKSPSYKSLVYFLLPKYLSSETCLWLASRVFSSKGEIFVELRPVSLPSSEMPQFDNVADTAFRSYPMRDIMVTRRTVRGFTQVRVFAGSSIYARTPINNARIKCTASSRSSVQSALHHSVGLKIQITEYNESL